MMGLSTLSPSFLLDPVVVAADAHVVVAWVCSFGHCATKTNTQSAPGVWEPSGGIIADTKNPRVWASIFGGGATFDEVKSAGLIVPHPSGVAGHWMPYGFNREAEVAYVNSCMRTRNATAARKAYHPPVTGNVTSNVTSNVPKTRPDQKRPDRRSPTSDPPTPDLSLPGGEPGRLRQGGR